jgi:hypothetical protein
MSPVDSIDAIPKSGAAKSSHFDPLDHLLCPRAGACTFSTATGFVHVLVGGTGVIRKRAGGSATGSLILVISKGSKQLAYYLDLKYGLECWLGTFHYSIYGWELAPFLPQEPLGRQLDIALFHAMGMRNGLWTLW